MENTITYVAMDTHKKNHKVALHYPGQPAMVEFSVPNTVRDIKRMVHKITRQAPGKVQFCYEAGVCGFTLKRRIEALGGCCQVIAPSLVPRKPGERVKTDRRDAKKLLRMFQAGLLTEVQAPNEAQEAARELTRLRETARDNLKRVRHQILKFLTRHGYVYTQGHHWTQSQHCGCPRTGGFYMVYRNPILCPATSERSCRMIFFFWPLAKFFMVEQRIK